MTQPDLSSLALPDSPELPAEIELKPLLDIMERYDTTGDELITARASIEKLFADRTFSAEEARTLRIAVTDHPQVDNSLYAKLRRLSGSSRGEE